MVVAQQRTSRYRFVVGGLIVLLNLSIGLSFYAISPLLPVIINDFGISRTAASLLIGLVILVQAIFSIPGGILVARMDKKLMLAAGGLLSSCMVLAFLSHSFGVLLTLRLVYGLGMAIMWPATGPLVMQWFSRRERPLWNSLNMAANSAGITISMFIAAPLAEAIGWREALSVLSIVAVVASMLWIVLGRSKAAQSGTEAQQRFSLREIRETVFSRTTLLMSMADASSYALYSAVTSWLPTYYNEVQGFSLTQVGLITGFLPFAGLIAVLMGGAMAAKFQRRKPLLLVPGIFMAVAAVGSFISGNLAIIYPSVFVLGFVSWFWPPILFVIPMELPGASPEKVAMVWGTVGTLASVMAFISPLTVGAMTDALGSYVPGFSLWAGFSLFFLLAVFLLPETGRPTVQQST